MLNVIVLSIVIYLLVCVIKLSVVRLNVVMLSVVAPKICGYGLSLNLLEQLTTLYSIRGLVALIENIRQT